MHTAHFSQLRGGEVLHNPPVKPRGSTQPPWMETPHPSACCEAKPPPVNRMTDRCKKLPCPKLLLRVVIIYRINFNLKLSVNQLTRFMYCDGKIAPGRVSRIIHCFVDYRPSSYPEPIPIHTRSEKIGHVHVIHRIRIHPPHPLAGATSVDLYVTWTATYAGRFLVHNLNKNYTI